MKAAVLSDFKADYKSFALISALGADGAALIYLINLTYRCGQMEIFYYYFVSLFEMSL